MKTKVSKVFTNNLGLKILGFILAALLWLALSNMQDSVEKRTLVVPVIYDESYLTENGYVASNKPTGVAVQVWVRRSNIAKLEADDFIAKVDTSEFLGSKLRTAPEKTKFNLEISKKTAATYIEEWDYPKIQGRYVEFEVDKVKTEFYRVGINLTGEAPDGVRIDASQIMINPQRVAVSGPTNSFGNLNSVKAIVDFSQLKVEDGAAAVTAKLQLYDGNNKPLNNTRLTLSQETVEVTMGLLASKTASISVVGYMGEPAAGYGCRNYDYEPKSVVITGTQNALAQVTTISIPKTELDISEATGDKTFEVSLQKYLPADISIPEEEAASIKVTVKIEKLEEASFLLSTENLEMIGCDDRYEYEILSPNVEITLRAFKEDLTAEKVSAAHLQGSINVTGIEPDGSTKLLPALLSMDRQYSLVKDVYIEIDIRSKEELSSAEDVFSSEIDEQTTDDEQSTEPPIETEDMTDMS